MKRLRQEKQRTYVESMVCYNMPSTCCMPRLTKEIQSQQQNPMRIGLPPDFTSLTISVLSPMAAIAMTMKNLDNVFKGANTVLLTPFMVQTVVMTDAKTKNRMKKGKIFFKL